MAYTWHFCKFTLICFTELGSPLSECYSFTKPRQEFKTVPHTLRLSREGKEKAKAEKAKKLRWLDCGKCRDKRTCTEERNCETKLGWTLGSGEPLFEASRIINPNDNDFDFASGVSEATWKRFCTGKKINADIFKVFCDVLGLRWGDVAVRENDRPSREDLHQAPKPICLYGRETELDQLKARAQENQITRICGQEGIGKSALVRAFISEVDSKYNRVFWRQLNEQDSFLEFLTDLIEFLCPDLPINGTETQSQLFRYLDQYLKVKAHKDLVVIDNWETVLETIDYSKTEYQLYEKFSKHIRLSNSSSRFLIISQINPLSNQPNDSSTLELEELSEQGMIQFAQSLGLRASNPEKLAIFCMPYGNPWVLKDATLPICSEGDGLVDNYLTTVYFGNTVAAQLNAKFRRLSFHEQNILCWIALHRAPVSIEQLQNKINQVNINQMNMYDITNALHALRKIRYWIKRENESRLYTLDRVRLKWITQDYFCKKCAKQISDAIQNPWNSTLEDKLFITHQFVTAPESDPLHIQQHNRIVRTIQKSLLTEYGSQEEVRVRLQEILERRGNQTGYAAENFSLLWETHS